MPHICENPNTTQAGQTDAQDLKVWRQQNSQHPQERPNPNPKSLQGDQSHSATLRKQSQTGRPNPTQNFKGKGPHAGWGGARALSGTDTPKPLKSANEWRPKIMAQHRAKPPPPSVQQQPQERPKRQASRQTETVPEAKVGPQAQPRDTHNREAQTHLDTRLKHK